MEYEYIAQIAGKVFAISEKEAIEIINKRHPTYCNITFINGVKNGK